MAAMLGERRGRLSLSAPTMRSLLDGIASRLDESRDLSRYMIGLLIFLGLLGTFWGLSQTIGSIGDVIRGLTVGGGDVAQVFEKLKQGLDAPLSGMGTAFSSSLFGLGGSLVLGFLDLQAARRRTASSTSWRTGCPAPPGCHRGALPGDGEQSMPVYVQALLEQTAESLETPAADPRPRRGRTDRHQHPPAGAGREDRRADRPDARRTGADDEAGGGPERAAADPGAAGRRLARRGGRHSTRRPARTSATSTSTSPG